MSVRIFALLFWCTLMQSCLHPVYAQQTWDETSLNTSWKITKTSWSTQDEKSYQEFIQSIGEAIGSRKCNTVTSCMNSSANSYRKSDPEGLAYRADCADFPYFLRAYFAWKNGLPFSLAIEMDLRNVPGNEGRDIRYSPYGNVVDERYAMTADNGQMKNALFILNKLIPNSVSSANFRTHYANDSVDLFTDQYPVQISRDSIQPGSMIYDPNGHVAVVYKVTDDGKVYFIDAHPDNSATSGTFSNKFVRSHPGQGAGFKKWRPLRLEGAQVTPQGFYLGGKIVAASNRELADYSVEQFFGNKIPNATEQTVDWKKAEFLIDGKNLTYYEFIRQKMSIGQLRIDPVDEFRSIVDDLCESLKDRVHSVDISIRSGISQKPHPERLPENIYGTFGEWEEFSTPSRDAQLKVSFMDLVSSSRDFIQKWKAQDPTIVYSGSTLAQDLLDMYQRESRACEIAYQNSSGRMMAMSLEQVRQRLFQLSFDPYHCIELRWGASSADELSSCSDNSNKRLWYVREQRLRNQPERQYEARTDFNLEDLLKPLPGNGIENPPDVDVVRFLKSQI
jgi:hypothetical protein